MWVRGKNNEVFVCVFCPVKERKAHVFVSEYVTKSKTFFDYVEDIKVSRFHLTSINPVPVQNLHCVIYTWIKTQITLTLSLFRLAIKRVKLYFSN